MSVMATPNIQVSDGKYVAECIDMVNNIIVFYFIDNLSTYILFYVILRSFPFCRLGKRALGVLTTQGVYYQNKFNEIIKLFFQSFTFELFMIIWILLTYV